MKNLPQAFVNRMKNILGEEYSLYEKAMSEEPVRAFRVNTEKISLEDFEKVNNLSNEKIPYVKNGYYLEKEKIGNHPFHQAYF